jgi:type II secretory pathway pseudopilin PulG
MRGMTLIELAVVMLILIAVAGLVVPMIGNTAKNAVCSTTDVTLVNIRDAILGGAAMSGYKNDLGMMPSYSRQFASIGVGAPNYQDGILSELYSNPVIPIAQGGVSFPAYNPTTRRGWNGPYLTGGFTCTNAPNASVCGTCGTAIQQNFAMDSYYPGIVGGGEYYHTAPPGGPAVQYCYNGQLSNISLGQTPPDGAKPVADPIKLIPGPVGINGGQPSATNPPAYYYLVSGGQNGQIETSSISATFPSGDDRVLTVSYPQQGAPGANQSCNQ